MERTTAFESHPIDLTVTEFTSKWYNVLGLVVGGAVTLAAIGWWLGPTKTDKRAPRTMSQAAGPGPMESPAVDKESEEILRKLMQGLNDFLQKGDTENAERQANKVLDFTAKTWGKNHLNYGLLLGMPVANVYEQMQNLEKLEASLISSYKILKLHGDEFTVETGVAERLVSLLNMKGDYKKAVEYTKPIVTVRKEALRSNPDAETVEKYCTSCNKVGTILANNGNFEEAEALFDEVLEICAEHMEITSTAYQACMENLTNALHQQGKTKIAVQKLEEYRSRIPDSIQSANALRKLLHRASTLLFTIDNFEESLKYLQELIPLYQGKPPAQVLCDLATVHWELGNTTQAKNAQDNLKEQPVTPKLPLVRSRYLCTLDCALINGEYELSMRVNRETPRRTEGTPVEPPETLKRRLPSCFLEVLFSPTTPGETIPPCAYDVNQPHQFIIKSPKMPPAEPGKWYEVVINIYTNETKAVKLGVHHQMVPATFLRDRPALNGPF